MKQFVLCLAVALLCGVAFSRTCEESSKALTEALNVHKMMQSTGASISVLAPLEQHILELENEIKKCNASNSTITRECGEALIRVNQSRESIESQKRRYSPDQSIIARLEADINNASFEISNNCPPAVACSFAKNELKIFEEEIASEKRKYSPSSEVIRKAESRAQNMKVHIALKCSAPEVCQFGKEEIKKHEAAIAAEKSRYSPDQKLIERLQYDLGFYKIGLFNTCPADEVCSFVKNEIVKDRNDIQNEKNRYSPDQQNIQRLLNEIDRLKTGMFNACPAEEVCAYIKNEIVLTQNAIQNEKNRYSPDQKVIARLLDDMETLKEAMTNKCPAIEVCQNAKNEIQNTRNALQNENNRYSPDQAVIARLQNDISNFQKVVYFRCPPHEACAFAHSEIKVAENAIQNEKNRYSPDQRLIERLQADIANLTNQIYNVCPAEEVCNYARSEINKTRAAIQNENNRYSPDTKAIARMNNYIDNLKIAMNQRCPAADLCFFGHQELSFARNGIQNEKNRYSPDQKLIEKYQTDAANATELVINSCNSTEACSFIGAEITRAQSDITSEKNRYSPDQRVIERLEASLIRLKGEQISKCGYSGFMRLAERAVKGGRFLMRLLKH